MTGRIGRILRHPRHYTVESEFRYNNHVANGPDHSTRAAIALRGVTGKRLLYRDSLVA